MHDLITNNLTRQFKGMELLSSLLEEEFQLLFNRDTDAVTALEFSIHELLRQIAVERMDLKSIMQGTRLLEYATLLPEEDGETVRRLYHLIDALEQRCSRQATHNTELSLALLDQSQDLLVFLHNQIQPKQTPCYGQHGKLREYRAQAAIFTGRF